MHAEKAERVVMLAAQERLDLAYDGRRDGGGAGTLAEMGW
jgi:hypothetical protein